MTPQPHTIRLRDPWQWAACESSDGPNIRVSRWFNRPTGLDPNTRVMLVIKGIPALRDVRLNDQELVGQRQAGDVWKCAIGKRLELRNQLQLEFNAIGRANAENSLRASLAAGNVRLEI